MKAFAAAFCAAALLAPALFTPTLAQAKEPPSCGAVNFRPLVNTANDGEMTAGHYKSRFATIDVMAQIQGGQASYHLRVNGQPVTPVNDVPKAVYPCLNSKHVKTPPQPMGGACTGSRFRVAIAGNAKQRLFMLFGLQGDDWKLCEAGTAAK